jgi:phosphatidylglycerophosphatase C
METGAMTDAIAAASPPSERVVLFDFDGVLLMGDAFTLFIRARYQRSLARRALGLLCLPFVALAAVCSRWWAMRLIVRIALLFVGDFSYTKLAQAFGMELARRPKLFSRDAIGALRRHLQAGEKVWVVTGCEERLARAILDELGLGEVNLLGSELQAGWFGMRVKRHNVHRRKVAALAARGLTSCVAAYSDSVRDIPMLRLATEPFMVNAAPRACKKVEKALGRSVGRVAWY